MINIPIVVEVGMPGSGLGERGGMRAKALIRWVRASTTLRAATRLPTCEGDRHPKGWETTLRRVVQDKDREKYPDGYTDNAAKIALQALLSCGYLYREFLGLSVPIWMSRKREENAKNAV